MKNPIPFNYGGLEKKFSSYSTANNVILPVPFEKTSSWIKGSAKGPSALIEASRHMELYDIESGREVYRDGIYTDLPVESEDTSVMIDEVYHRNLKFLQAGKFPVTLGGEHTVSIGAIKAALEHEGKVSILHLDAHSDFRSVYEGDPYSHACVMSRAAEMGADIFSVGIRSMDSSEKERLKKEKTVFAHEIPEDEGWQKKVLEGLEKKVFLDIDLDVFDPSVIPATGTPEPGGLYWYQVTDLIKKVSLKKDIIGLGVVELCPVNDNKISEFSAAVLIYKILSYLSK